MHGPGWCRGLRATAARYPGDPGVRELVDELSAISTKFASFWSDHEVTTRTSDHYRLLHPQVGVLELDYEILHFHDGGQRLMVYSAEDGTKSFGRLRDLCRNLQARDAHRAGMAPA